MPAPSEPAAPDATPDDPQHRRQAELVRRAAAGDRAAADALLTEHLSRLRAFVRLRMGPLVRSKESSEDLVQSVCLEALQDLGDFEYRGPETFRFWLFRAAERKVIDRGRFWRRDRRDPGREQREADTPDTLRALATLFTPSRDASATEEIARLEAALNELSADDREVILLARVMELSHERIAEQMNRSVSATWSLLSRALARLATRLGEPA